MLIIYVSTAAMLIGGVLMFASNYIANKGRRY